MSVTWPCVTCHVASPLSWSWLARLKCAYSGVKTMSGKIQIRTSDSQLWHNELVVNFPAASNVFIYTFQFSCWITQVIQGWHGLIIHRWKHPDVASLSLCPLVVFGTLWTGCDNIIDVITLFGVIDIGRADHMPICGTLRCQAGSIMGSVAVTTGDQSPLRGNFTITCQGTWLLAQLDRQNTRQYPPPITGHTDHEPLLVTRPSWYNKHLCQVFCCDQQSFIVRMLLSWYQMASPVSGAHQRVRTPRESGWKLGRECETGRQLAWGWSEQVSIQTLHDTAADVSRVTCPMGGAETRDTWWQYHNLYSARNNVACGRDWEFNGVADALMRGLAGLGGVTVAKNVADIELRKGENER